MINEDLEKKDEKKTGWIMMYWSCKKWKEDENGEDRARKKAETKKWSRIKEDIHRGRRRII